MPITLLMSGTYADNSMEDGFVRVEAVEGYPLPNYFMTKATFRALSFHDGGESLVRMYDVMETMPEGTHAIPRSVIEPDAAYDVELALSILDPPAHSDDCAMSGCLQDVASVTRGFPLCARHDSLLQDWDSLVA